MNTPITLSILVCTPTHVPAHVSTPLLVPFQYTQPLVRRTVRIARAPKTASFASPAVLPANTNTRRSRSSRFSSTDGKTGGGGTDGISSDVAARMDATMDPHKIGDPTPCPGGNACRSTTSPKSRH
jgi:hypothetical protein